MVVVYFLFVFSKPIFGQSDVRKLAGFIIIIIIIIIVIIIIIIIIIIIVIIIIAFLFFLFDVFARYYYLSVGPKHGTFFQKQSCHSSDGILC